MTDPAPAINPYATPRAQVEGAAMEAVMTPFFGVGIYKLLLLSALTFNFYLVYWFYQNWQRVRMVGKGRPNAVLRSVFYSLTAYSLFKRMRTKSAALGETLEFAPGGVAWMLLLFLLVSMLPAGFFLLALGTSLVLVPIQRQVNAINLKRAPAADRNESFSGVNIVFMLAGGVVLALVLIGLLLPA